MYVLTVTLGLEILWKSQWNFHYSCSGGSIALRPEKWISYWSVLIQGGSDAMLGGQQLGWLLAKPISVGKLTGGMECVGHGYPTSHYLSTWEASSLPFSVVASWDVVQTGKFASTFWGGPSCGRHSVDLGYAMLFKKWPEGPEATRLGQDKMIGNNSSLAECGSQAWKYLDCTVSWP